VYNLMFSFITRNTLDEFLEKFEKTPADLQTYLSSGALIAAADKQPMLIDKCKFCTCWVLSSCIVIKQV